jgi:hypothetical protein
MATEPGPLRRVARQKLLIALALVALLTVSLWLVFLAGHGSGGKGEGNRLERIMH